MLKDFHSIFFLNTFHARIILLALYLEKCSFFKLPFKIFRKLFVQLLYNCEISPISFRDKQSIVTCRLPHPYSIIIHSSATIGNNCTIFQSVTIGVIESTGKNPIAATIHDNVYIGCKASILGNIVVNENAKIGAHALVLKEVGKDVTVIGVHK